MRVPICNEGSMIRPKALLNDAEVMHFHNATILLVSIRYKPEDDSEHPTDRYGYIQTELQPVMTLRNLSEEEVAQVKEFAEDTMAEETIHATRKKSIGEKIEGRIKSHL